MPEPFRSILCATDLSPRGDQALHAALALADEGAVVHLLHVCAPEQAILPGGMAPLGSVLATGSPRRDALEAARCHLETLAALACGRGSRPEVQTHVASASDAADAILGFAADAGVDAIVLSDRGRSTWDRWFAGSVARSVRRRANVPVVLVRPGGSHDVGRDAGT